jgi:hypothetical protein
LISSFERAVALEVIAIAMKIVRARAEDDVHHHGPAEANLGAGVRLLDVEFLDGID